MLPDVKHGQTGGHEKVTVDPSKQSGLLLVVCLQNYTCNGCPHVRNNVL